MYSTCEFKTAEYSSYIELYIEVVEVLVDSINSYFSKQFQTH